MIPWDAFTDARKRQELPIKLKPAAFPKTVMPSKCELSREARAAIRPPWRRAGSSCFPTIGRKCYWMVSAAQRYTAYSAGGAARPLGTMVSASEGSPV